MRPAGMEATPTDGKTRMEAAKTTGRNSSRGCDPTRGRTPACLDYFIPSAQKLRSAPSEGERASVQKEMPDARLPIRMIPAQMSADDRQ